jgi:hypothetical protein
MKRLVIPVSLSYKFSIEMPESALLKQRVSIWSLLLGQQEPGTKKESSPRVLPE